MQLNPHDVEEEMRSVLGRLYDAREQYAQVPNKANAEGVIARCEEALAASQNIVRKALS